jgi:catechol 2,3-dioxygenase
MHSPTSSPPAIAPATSMGAVWLTVTDLQRSQRFYEGVLGLHPRRLDDGEMALDSPGGSTLLRLRADPSAPGLDRRATGLFHLALLLPTRLDLAHALMRIVRAGYPLDGASDHLVSEALYLSDPDGNGIEIYHDRPREQWNYEPDGQIQMATLALDLSGVADELPAGAAVAPRAPEGARIGHVHLQVADIPRAEAFYHGILGFDVVVRGYPGALFVSAGGYHHHLGLNTWNSAGSAPPSPGAVGLRLYEVRLPDAAQRDQVVERLTEAGIAAEPAPHVTPGAVAVRDPFGITLVLTT